MTIQSSVWAAQDDKALQAALDKIPYARFLGLALGTRDERLVMTLRFSDRLIGDPVRPALHGGTVGALLEIAGTLELMRQIDSRRPPKAIDVSIDYLRSGRPVDTYAAARITRQGRRVANVRVEAWQQSPEKPIALAQIHFLLT